MVCQFCVVYILLNRAQTGKDGWMILQLNGQGFKGADIDNA